MKLSGVVILLRFLIIDLLIFFGVIGNSFADATVAPNSALSSAVSCYKSSDGGLRCVSKQDAPVLIFSFDFLDINNKSIEVLKIGGFDGKQFFIDSGSVCERLAVNISGAAQGVNLSSMGTCSIPVRMCVNLKFEGGKLDFKKQVAVVQSGDYAFGIQSDERLGTEIDPSHKVINLCTNPVPQKNLGWSVYLAAGTRNDVKMAMQAIRAPIVNDSGEVIGFPKTASVIKDGYLFVDLTEKNSPYVISLAKKGGFPFVLVYGSTWATTYGTYEFNKLNYPSGLSGFKSVVGAANAERIGVGLHLLTGFVSKRDPYVMNGQFDYLLKDDESELYKKIGPSDDFILAADSISGFPEDFAYYGVNKAGLDILIDNEIIQCLAVKKSEIGVFSDCKRGAYGTKAVSHEAGVKIRHMTERYGSYLADLSRGLKSLIGDRISGVVNAAGVDMIYFDGGEVGSANGYPGWYVAEQQIDILKKVRRPLLVEGSGLVPRLWPYLTRVVNDDFAALSPLTYLDSHKINRLHLSNQEIYMPDNLGWIGLLKETPSYPPTTPEEMSTYVARSIAIDTPLSIETHVDDLVNNPYTSRLMDIVNVGNRLIRSNSVSLDDRGLLKKGIWYYEEKPVPSLLSLRKIDSSVSSNANATSMVRVRGDEKKLALRIRNVSIKTPHHPENPIIVGGGGVVVPPPPDISNQNRGILAASIKLAKIKSVSGESSFVDFLGGASGVKSVDFSSARSMLVEFDYGEKSLVDGKCVLNIQLQDNRGQFKDYLIYLSQGKGQRVVIGYEDSAPAVIADMIPARSNYAFKASIYGFNYSAVTKLNLRWMRSCNEKLSVSLKRVEMLREFPSVFKNIYLNVDGKKYFVASSVVSGETLDVFPNGVVSKCKEGDCVVSSIAWPPASLLSGSNVYVEYETLGSAEVSIGLLGKRVLLQ